MSLERKCPVCGHVGATLVSPYSDMLRCGLCGLTDSGHMFKDATPQPMADAAHDEPFPNLARAGLTGFVGNDVTLADVERLARAFDCTLVKTNETVIDLDRLAYAQMAQAANESKWIPPSYVSNDWISDVCDFLRNGHACACKPSWDGTTP